MQSEKREGGRDEITVIFIDIADNKLIANLYSSESYLIKFLKYIELTF